MHSLRHPFASALNMAGATVTEVQSLLGHSSAAVTLKVDSHWFKKRGDRGQIGGESNFRLQNLGHFSDTLEVAPKADTA
jgi:integrase